MKAKGVSLKRNTSITSGLYYALLQDGSIVQGRNMSLQLKKEGMSKVEVTKTALSAAHTKMRVQDDGSVCLPFVYQPNVASIVNGKLILELNEDNQQCNLD